MRLLLTVTVSILVAGSALTSGCTGAANDKTVPGDSGGEGDTCTVQEDCKTSAEYWCVEGACTYAQDYSGGASDEDWSSPEGFGGSDEPQEIGAVIDTFCGIDAYQNGSDAGAVYETGTHNDGAYGYEYQCTELAYRFVCQHYDLCDSKTERHGDAWQWFTNPYDNDVLAQLTPYTNGGSEPPRAGDVLVLDKTSTNSWGHVAVVEEVLLDTGLITVIEQNCYSCSHAHVLNTSGGSYTVNNALGWLRPPGAAACDG